jgi:hypothetical protein
VPSYCPRSSLPAKVLGWLAARLAHLTPPRRPGQGGTRSDPAAAPGSHRAGPGRRRDVDTGGAPAHRSAAYGAGPAAGPGRLPRAHAAGLVGVGPTSSSPAAVKRSWRSWRTCGGRNRLRGGPMRVAGDERLRLCCQRELGRMDGVSPAGKRLELVEVEGCRHCWRSALAMFPGWLSPGSGAAVGAPGEGSLRLVGRAVWTGR